MQIYRLSNLITLALAFLALLPRMECNRPITPRPLCASQFALANYACATLPVILRSPPSPSLPPPLPHSPDSRSSDGGGEDGGGGGGSDNNKDRHGSRGGHGHGHGHEDGHGHGHGHHHKHNRPLTPQEENCCRWVKEVDSQCVCEVLIRLPPFLVRPGHQYIVDVGQFCHVTYSCGGPI